MGTICKREMNGRWLLSAQRDVGSYQRKNMQRNFAFEGRATSSARSSAHSFLRQGFLSMGEKDVAINLTR